VHAGVAEGRAADFLRGDLADRRGAEVAARVPGQLHGHHHGRGTGPAGLAQALVRLLDPVPAPQRDAHGLAGRSHRDADRARADRRVRPQDHLHRRDRVQPADLGHRRGVRRPVHLRRLRHRHRHHLRGRVRRPARAQLLRRPSRYSADYYLEQKISWWWKIAETRRPAPAQAPASLVPPPAAPDDTIADVQGTA